MFVCRLQRLSKKLHKHCNRDCVLSNQISTIDHMLSQTIIKAWHTIPCCTIPIQTGPRARPYWTPHCPTPPFPLLPCPVVSCSAQPCPRLICLAQHRTRFHQEMDQTLETWFETTCVSMRRPSAAPTGVALALRGCRRQPSPASPHPWRALCSGNLGGTTCLTLLVY